MKCPKCKTIELKKAKIAGISIDCCQKCKGIWFGKDELRIVKDKKLKKARWLDAELKVKSLDWFKFDLWNNKKKFKLLRAKRKCPSCKVPLTEVGYMDSDIKIDACGICWGVWLDKGEFKRIIAYVKNKADYKIINNFFKNFVQETAEVFVGPENIFSEIEDVLVMISLLKYKFMAQHPFLSKLFMNLPLSK